MTLLLVLTLPTALFFLVTQPFVAARISAPPAVDPARLEAHIRVLSQVLYPRSFDRPVKLEAAASYIADAFHKAGGQVEDQYFDVEGSRYRNVIARFGPQVGPVLVIGAHYDSYGDASRGSMSSSDGRLGGHTPGADDNASGVVGLLELARLLQLKPPSIPIELVAYTLEEPPYFRTESMGSVRHALSLRGAGRSVSVMICLETIGYFSDKPSSQRYPFYSLGLAYPSRGDFIAIIGRFSDWSATRKAKAAMMGATSLPVYSMNGPALIPGVDFSDHASYWTEGIPALMITDSAFYRNPNYHQTSDTIETLDLGRMSKVVQGVYAITQTYAVD